MLDPFIRPWIDPPLHSCARHLIRLGITADALTIGGGVFGLMAMGCISQELYGAGLFFLVLNRLCDGLDGAVARHSDLTDFGGFLDIVCDFLIYAGIVFAFALANPSYGVMAAFLIFSFIGPMVSFLAYAIIAAKREITCDKRGKKSFYYLGGLCEGTETAFFLGLMCLMPLYFEAIALVFGVMCWITTAGRIYQARQHFTVAL